MPVTCEVTPHHLLLSTEDLKRIGMIALTLPPVRDRKDNLALLRGLQQGSADNVASDHAPHALEEKRTESIWDVKGGIPGLETTLPLLLTHVNRGLLSIGDVVRLMATSPAEIFAMKRVGSLTEGNQADLTVVDLTEKFKVDSATFHSKAKYSPFDGWPVQGKAVKTFVRGQLIMDEGEIVAKAGSGSIIRRE
jgi:dihydroorotase